jgi:phenylacetate-coenzyme A ligase PaaK-like adenylate-forming protein
LCGLAASEVVSASHAGPQALQALRAQRLRKLVAAARRDSPLYRRLFHGLGAATELRDLPVVHKHDLMRDFDEWVTDPAIRLEELRRFVADGERISEAYLGRYTVWQSSGSSGEPAIFVQDAMAMAVCDALEAFRRPWSLSRLLDPWYATDRFVFVGATGGHFASIVTLHRLRHLNPLMSAGLHDISFLQPVPDMVAQLHGLKPTIVSTYPSAAMLLAEERLAGRLHIEPREIWTGGESLTAAMREFVGQAFGCAVVNSYGASEFLSLASECRCGHLHVNSDWAILESVDDRGRPVRDGELGATVLLTNLANAVQPLIRYDLGDRIKVHAQPCLCGSHLPTVEVLGRSDDILRLGAPGRAVSLLPLALTTVLEEEGALSDFQLEQIGPQTLLLSIPTQGDAADQSLRHARAALANFLDQQGLRSVHIRCLSGHRPKRGAGGKVRRVIAMAASRSVPAGLNSPNRRG